MSDDDEATDALWDCSARALAARYGDVALGRLRAGRDVEHVARLAASYAALALDEEPSRIAPFRLPRKVVTDGQP